MDEASRSNGSTTSDAQTHVLIFRLDRYRLAIPVQAVMQIIPMVAITPIPQLDAAVAGVIDVHGSTVPVIDLGCHLELAPRARQLYTPIVLTTLGTRTCGLIVDEVLGVHGLPAGLVVPTSEVLPDGLHSAPVLQGLADAGDGLVVLLDPQYLFDADQARLLAEAVEWMEQHRDPVPPPERGPA